MEHLIDKDILITEINKRRNKHFNSGGSPSSEYCYEDDEILNIIDTLELKEVREESVSEDLEESASRYAKEEYNHKNPATLPDRCRGCYAPLMYAFKAGAKWQKEKDSILPKVWNRENLDEFSYQTAYDLSNDWIKETPTWHDVEMACKLGAKWKEEQLEKEKGRNNNDKN